MSQQQQQLANVERIPRNIKLEKHFVLIKYTGKHEVVRMECVGNDFRISNKYAGIYD